MKVYIIILAVIILITILFQSFINMSTNRTEEQKYIIIHKYNEIKRFSIGKWVDTVGIIVRYIHFVTCPSWVKLKSKIFRVGDSTRSDKVNPRSFSGDPFGKELGEQLIVFL